MAAPLESSDRNVVVDDTGNSPLLLSSVEPTTDNAIISAYQNLSAESNFIVAGACAYRELTTGVECGCRAFWKFNGHQTTVQEENCACGHHACFHDQTDVSARALTRTISGIGPPVASSVGREVVGHLKEVGRLLSELPATENNVESDQAAVVETLHSTAGLGLTPELGSKVSVVEGHRENVKVEDQPQQHNNGGVPEGLGLVLRNDEEPIPDNDAQQAPQSQTGVSSVNSESVARAIQRFLNESPGPWGRAVAMEASNEIAEEAEPSTRQLLPPLSVGDYRSLPGFEDLLQSATELATPSVGNQTPDINNIQPAILRPRTVPQDSPVPALGKSEMPPPDAIIRHGTPRMGQLHRPNTIFTPNSQTLSPPPFIVQDSANLAQVAHHLSLLNKYISNHGSQIRGLVGRLDIVERSSFLSQSGMNQDMVDKLDHIEARVIDVESKIDDHSKALWRGDSDVPSSDVGDKSRRRNDLGSQTGSEASRSLTDGQLVQTLETRVAYLEDRILSIERCLPPSLRHPYEIEIVFLPWGRQLRGIWVEDRDSGSRFNTQDSEDWANSRSVQQSSARFSVVSATEPSGNVWDRQSIYDWAENTAEWLLPRACGIKSVAYHRLKSRGFVRKVEWTRPGAREIQDSITKAFGDLMPFKEFDHNDDAELDEKGKNFLGLQAPFIPLRKVRGSSKLCFLAQPEMVTSALWTAEFLVSSAVMKAVGGLRRLFITEKESYLQRPSRDDYGWTWAKMKDLPRYPPNETGNESHWEYHQVLDAPLSVHSSFASQDSSLHMELDIPKIRPGLESPIKIKSGEQQREQTTKTSFVPITPITNPSQDFNYRSTSEFPFPSSGQDLAAGGTISSQFARANASGNSLSGNSRYYLRRHGRAVSNPQFGQTSTEVRTSMLAAEAQIRSFSASQAAEAASASNNKRSRGFDTPSNPLLPSIPNFVPSPKATTKKPALAHQPPTPGFAPYQTPRTVGSRSNSGNLSVADTILIEQFPEIGAGHGHENTSNKRRRLSHSRGRSMSVVSSIPAITKPGGSTPGQGPYLTPFSGNFAAFSESGGMGIASNNDAESWKGVDHDHDEHDIFEGTQEQVDDVEEEDDDMFSDDF